MPEDTYLGCLKASFQSNHHYSAEEVRSLCEEISGSINPSYKFIEGELVPENEFTKCYSKETKRLDNLGVDEAEKAAKFLCKYKKE